MRFISNRVEGYRIHAVTGTNTVSFAIDFSQADTNGLLGFAVERHDPVEDERYYLYGFKLFESVHPIPAPGLPVSTRDHPIQSFVYDDFTAKPDRTYTYYFHPLKGKPKRIDRSAAPIPIVVKTEPAFSALEHDIFFNRGTASSQAYQRRFGNLSPDQLKQQGEAKKSRQALDWLSRDLDDAILRFIKQARRGDTLLGCFYEFRYEPVFRALKEAADTRGVTIRIIVDAKENATGDEEAFPREENLRRIEEAGLVVGQHVLLRTARKNDIQHNKFLVWLKGSRHVPRAVWTGSTNLSIGGIHGQANVGHWIRNTDVATQFKDYWELIATDPGGTADDNRTEVRRKNEALRKAVAAIDEAPVDWRQYPPGITPIFSPRQGLEILQMYASLLDDAEDLACVTLAFGINKVFKERLADNTSTNALTFFLLEREDKPAQSDGDTFVRLSAQNNAYMAFGSYLREPLHQWARETTAGALGFNKHVSFIHSKFLLKDPLGSDPIVVTGSANFSAASTNDNDENMVVIRGDRRVADIYFTEFNRLFFHYYFRSVLERFARHSRSNGGPNLFLDESDGWLAKYAPGSLRRKRVEAFVRMRDAQTLDEL
ncbi:MAG: phospholipase protein [Proteobacteria bacterium]|nr:phospholipase protein [Pseudomonadota bacterium]